MQLLTSNRPVLSSDSAKLADAGALWHATEHLRFGAALAILSSDTYNQGRTFIAPLPMAAYAFRPVTVNVVCIYRNLKTERH